MIYQMQDSPKEEALAAQFETWPSEQDSYRAPEGDDHYESGDPALEHDELHRGDDWGPEFEPGLDSPTDFDEFESNYDDCAFDMGVDSDEFN